MSRALRVVVADRNLVPHRRMLDASVPSNVEMQWLDRCDEEAVASCLPGTHVLVGSRFTPAMTAAADSLELVHVPGAGCDGIALEALPAGTRVVNTFHHEGSIAEYIVATTVMLRRTLAEQDAALRQGRWVSSVYEPSLPQPASLEGSLIGFVGFGHIGQRTWQAFRALGARGIAVTRTGLRPEGEDSALQQIEPYSALPWLLAISDVVVLCVPLTDDTRGMIGREQLALMHQDAMLVNVARGPVVDPTALYDALDQRRIGGAVLDTWYRYPGPEALVLPAEQPFGRLPNVIMTPHSSGVTRQTYRGRAEDIGTNITNLARGQALERVVFPQ